MSGVSQVFGVGNSQGLVVEDGLDEVPDSHSIEIRLTVLEVNVADETVTFAGYVALT